MNRFSRLAPNVLLISEPAARLRGRTRSDAKRGVAFSVELGVLRARKTHARGHSSSTFPALSFCRTDPPFSFFTSSQVAHRKRERVTVRRRKGLIFRSVEFTSRLASEKRERRAGNNGIAKRSDIDFYYPRARGSPPRGFISLENPRSIPRNSHVPSVYINLRMQIYTRSRVRSIFLLTDFSARAAAPNGISGSPRTPSRDG